MTRADDHDDLVDPLGYATGEERLPKLVIVAIVWAGFGAVGLLTALLMHSAGIAVFGVLCVLAGGALYLGQRTREQLEHDEARLRADPWGEPEDGEAVDDDEYVTHSTSTDDATTTYENHDHDEDIVDAEFSEYFDYDQAPADQDDGTGYDEEEMAYQRYQADRRAREAEAAHADDEDGHVIERDDDEDDEARTSRIPHGGGAEPETDTHGGSDGSRR
ncbi:hypothetical protein LQ327_10550 [Actinomycetospora endophytica]|uniref:DUF3040 family protein n=1 Tax=Actinomycetospora endophytica TaxID=2291215 RepID=A0ABS8P6C1_9PSEU|nr:phage holin family protein [Actinomycetospora endophytica]MCD2193814.1 hypothetical protein [Actinomycetospora endophytica]